MHFILCCVLGTVSYQSFDSNNPLASRVFSDVNNYIRTNRNSTNYQGIWMLLIEWSAARPYPQGVFSDPFFDLVIIIIIFIITIYYIYFFLA